MSTRVEKKKEFRRGHMMALEAARAVFAELYGNEATGMFFYESSVDELWFYATKESRAVGEFHDLCLVRLRHSDGREFRVQVDLDRGSKSLLWAKSRGILSRNDLVSDDAAWPKEMDFALPTDPTIRAILQQVSV